MIEYLIKDYFTLDDEKFPPIIALIKLYDQNEALIWASENGHLELVKYLFENGADIQAEDNEALRWTSKNGHLKVVKYLVENGADVQARDNYVLRWASRNGYLEIVKYLESL